MWAWHYLSSCALVARSWVWSSRSHQFRTLHFVYSRQRQQLSGLLDLIRSPICTINNHVFEINLDLLTLLASDMMSLASLSKIRSIELRGPPWPSPPEVASWQDGLSTLLASFTHLTTLEISFVSFTSLSPFATLAGACSNLQTLSIRIAYLPLGSPSDTYPPRHFPPPAMRSLRVTESGGRCDALYDWLSSAPKPLRIDSIVIRTCGREYTASLLGLLRNAEPSLENLAIYTPESKCHVSACFAQAWTNRTYRSTSSTTP
ncbi:hypothetical protein FIBSPDRAFT_35656 [Athelia psychrophila]|uniref:F-box domain-containing protein n=1 Tax=Athelia psychrophila TaxID=1759441 RepID=A0A166FRQ7_9AGAM|nr:hypothetical protein FIBSPDRAFT_35656 [Fibularhizoctonia sp. CBS 109695]